MVVVVFEMRNHICCCAARGTYGGGFGFQERSGWFLQLGLYVLLYGALVGGLY